MKEENQIPEEVYNFPEVVETEVTLTQPKPKVNFSDLSPLEKIRLASSNNGIIINDTPKKNCKKCYGRGYVSIQHETKLPNACKCLFSKEDWEKSKTEQRVWNRETRRKHKMYDVMGG